MASSSPIQPYRNGDWPLSANEICPNYLYRPIYGHLLLNMVYVNNFSVTKYVFAIYFTKTNQK